MISASASMNGIDDGVHLQQGAIVPEMAGMALKEASLEQPNNSAQLSVNFSDTAKGSGVPAF